MPPHTAAPHARAPGRNQYRPYLASLIERDTQYALARSAATLTSPNAYSRPAMRQLPASPNFGTMDSRRRAERHGGLTVNDSNVIDYGVQPPDGRPIQLYFGKKFAEAAVASEGGEVVFRVDRGPWQRAEDKVVISRSDLAAALAVLTAYIDDADLDQFVVAAHRGLVDRLGAALRPRN